jgi:hypothetical protein
MIGFAGNAGSGGMIGFAGDAGSAGSGFAGQSGAAGGFSEAGNGGGGSSGGSGGSFAGFPTAGGGGQAGSSGDTVVIPDAGGWIERDTNPLGIQGAWYPYGDQYGQPGRCISVGLHAPADCAEITFPTPPPFGTALVDWTGTFDNVSGEMCTSGSTAIIQQCMAGVATEGCPDNDYANMLGAGIGFDLNADERPPDGTGMSHVWIPPQDVIGFSFEINAVPAATKLRVEILSTLTDAEAAAVGLPSGSTSEDHPKGSPYWITVGTPSQYPPSAVRVGVNRVLWSEIKHPTGAIDLTTVPINQRLLGIRFHTPSVPKGSASRGAFNYCVRNLTFITQ